MEIELAGLKRACLESPSDVPLALKLAAELERQGRFVEAFEELARISPHARWPNGRLVEDMVFQLAWKHAGALAAALARRPVTTECLKLVHEVGASPVIATAACEPAGDRDCLAQLSRLLSDEDPARLREDVVRVAGYAPPTPEELSARMPLLQENQELIPQIREDFERDMALGGADWLFENAEEEGRRGVRWLPLLAALLDVPHPLPRERARRLFREISGRDAPPLDARELWNRSGMRKP